MHFENVVNAFWNVDNAFQRNEIFIENHFKIVAETLTTHHNESENPLKTISKSLHQSCPILTTCSGRESQDWTRMSRTSKPGECDTFNEKNMTFDLVKLHLIKEGPGPANSYESYDSFRS